MKNPTRFVPSTSRQGKQNIYYLDHFVTQMLTTHFPQAILFSFEKHIHACKSRHSRYVHFPFFSRMPSNSMCHIDIYMTLSLNSVCISFKEERPSSSKKDYLIQTPKDKGSMYGSFSHLQRRVMLKHYLLSILKVIEKVGFNHFLDG